MAKTIIIAEIGECFNGDIERARQMISEAKIAGCDIVKFQTLDRDSISPDDPEADWFRKISLSPEIIDNLIDYAKKCGIDILFTPANVKTALWLVKAGLREAKIASCLVQDMELINFVGANFDRVFLSTGMASLEEIDNAVDGLAGVKKLYVLHCVSEYPTGPLLEKKGLRALRSKDVRLDMMRMLIDRYPNLEIGYSDHTSGILAPIAAVACGARVIEKHITLDRKTPLEQYEKKGKYLGTDHVLSVEPKDLRKMVKEIREVELMFGRDGWSRSEGEEILKEFLRGRFRNEKR